MDVISKNTEYFIPIWTIHLFVWIVIYLVDTSVADDSMIDENQLKQYPFCGRMSHSHPSNSPTGRVVNSGIPEHNYRWTLCIERTNRNKHGYDDIFSCSGSVITDR